MSEHTKGPLVARDLWLVPADQAARPIGGSTNKEQDRDHYANVVATVREKYHDGNANARRLAATWNMFIGIETDSIELMPSFAEFQEANAETMGILAVERDQAVRELADANTRIAKLEALVAERDAMLGKRPCQNSRCNELNAARDLLREVIADTGIVSHIDACQRAQEYLDACDTLEGNKLVDATGCRKCGDILPAGHYCKAPACPLNPQMKGK